MHIRFQHPPTDIAANKLKYSMAFIVSVGLD